MPVGAEQRAAPANEPVSAQQIIAARLDETRGFLRELAIAVPNLPDELGYRKLNSRQLKNLRPIKP
jgi:hypothetical protein